MDALHEKHQHRGDASSDLQLGSSIGKLSDPTELEALADASALPEDYLSDEFDEQAELELLLEASSSEDLQLSQHEDHVEALYRSLMLSSAMILQTTAEAKGRGGLVLRDQFLAYLAKSHRRWAHRLRTT